MPAILGLVLLVLYIFSIVDVVKSSMDTGKKILWIILVILFPPIGTILYFLIGRKK